MALTITKRPEKFTPAGSPIFWQIETDDADMVYFEVEVIEPTSNAVLYTGKITPTPRLQDGAYIDLSTILSTTVDWQVKPDPLVAVAPITKSVMSYRIKFKEKKLVGATIVDGMSYDNTSDVNFVFNATLDKIAFNDFSDDGYVLRDDDKQIKFLTTKPNLSYTKLADGSFLIGDQRYKPDVYYVNMASSEYLYFLCEKGTSFSVLFTVYNESKNYKDSFSQYVNATENMYRVNASPETVDRNISIPLAEGDYYTVCITHGSSFALKTEQRTYHFVDGDCGMEYVNLHWVNHLGGLDSYQFVNPTDNLNVNRVQYEKETYRLDNNGIYSYVNGDVYNVKTEIIDSKPQVKVNINTKKLSDAEVDWLSGLVMSKQVFVELTDGKFVPVTLNDASFNYQRTRYMQNQLNTMKFSFSFPNWFLPALSDVTYKLKTVYENRFISKNFQKVCPAPEFIGTYINYIVPAAKYTSKYSQAEADQLAIDEINAEGQTYTNTHGFCSAAPLYGNEFKSAVFYSTGCASGSVPVAYTYSVPSGTYQDYTQAGADNMALADIAANGQAAADAANNCTLGVGNQVQSQVFYSSVCDSGSTPDPYTVTVAVDTFYATTQLAANQLALDWIAANGQSEADANGSCTMSTTINLYPFVFVQTGSFGYNDYYLSYAADSAVQDNILIKASGDASGSAIYVPSISMSVGDTNSYQIWLGQFPTGSSVDVAIWNVTPNPGGSGTIYQF